MQLPRHSLAKFPGYGLLLFLMLSTLAAGKCIPIEAASGRIGETVCVTGTVLKVAQTRKGHVFLDFCPDYSTCPFTVFVPRRNLRDVGDVRQLEGKTIEISGKIRSYGGRAEILLKNVRQLKGEAAKIPPVPKDYDVERQGRFGKHHYPTSRQK